MSDESRSFLFSVLAVVAGLATAAGCSLFINRTELSAQKSVESEFRELSATQQKQLMYLAERFTDCEPGEQQKLRELHAAVAEDSELEHKLEAYHAWWEKLDRDQQDQLKSDGAFSADWCRQVQNVYREDQVASNVITARSTRGNRMLIASFTEQEFDGFLDQILPQPPHSSLMTEIEALDRSQKVEATLTRTLWFFENLEEVAKKAGGPMEFSERLKTAARIHLHVPEPTDQRPFPGMSSRIDFGAVLLCFRTAVRHFDRKFHEKQDLTDGDDYLAIYDQLESSDQLNILKLDSDTAKRHLRNRDLAQNQSSAIADRLNKYYQKERYLFGFFGSRGRFGGSGDRGRNGGPDDRGRGGGPGKGMRPPGYGHR